NYKVNTTASKETQQYYPSSPSFRRTMLSNVRQSWIFKKPPPIPEAESVYVQPTAILEKNLTTAKSRLSVYIQKDVGIQQQQERVITNGTHVKIEQDNKETETSPTINEVSDIENLAD